METSTFRTYLKLLQELTGTLGQLTELEKEKNKAVLGDDLDVLNRCMQREQALSLTLRGYDAKREKLLAELGLSDVHLRDLAGRAPEECRLETKKVVEELRKQFDLHQAAAKVARNTLEINLHEIERILGQREDEQLAPGYDAKKPTEPPAGLRTDFRA